MVYVADTDFQLSAITWMKQERRKLINTMSGGDWNTKEQILDFYYDTQFRRSLLCHESQAHLLRHNEEFLIETLDSLYFGMVNKGKELKDTDNAVEQAIVNQCRKGEFFNVADCKAELERLQNGAEYNEIELYSMLIRFLLCGFILPVTEKKEITTFQEGMSTVPKEMANYVQTVVDRGGHKFINISDLYNDSITGFNSGHVLMMKELETPKTLEELYVLADEKLKVNETESSGKVVEIAGRTVVDGVLDDLGRLGFLCNK